MNPVTWMILPQDLLAYLNRVETFGFWPLYAFCKMRERVSSSLIPELSNLSQSLWPLLCIFIGEKIVFNFLKTPLVAFHSTGP